MTDWTRQPKASNQDAWMNSHLNLRTRSTGSSDYYGPRHLPTLMIDTDLRLNCWGMSTWLSGHTDYSTHFRMMDYDTSVLSLPPILGPSKVIIAATLEEVATSNEVIRVMADWRNVLFTSFMNWSECKLNLKVGLYYRILINKSWSTPFARTAQFYANLLIWS